MSLRRSNRGLSTSSTNIPVQTGLTEFTFQELSDRDPNSTVSPPLAIVSQATAIPVDVQFGDFPRVPVSTVSTAASRKRKSSAVIAVDSAGLDSLNADPPLVNQLGSVPVTLTAPMVNQLGFAPVIPTAPSAPVLNLPPADPSSVPDSLPVPINVPFRSHPMRSEYLRGCASTDTLVGIPVGRARFFQLSYDSLHEEPLSPENMDWYDRFLDDIVKRQHSTHLASLGKDLDVYDLIQLPHDYVISTLILCAQERWVSRRSNLLNSRCSHQVLLHEFHVQSDALSDVLGSIPPLLYRLDALLYLNRYFVLRNGIFPAPLKREMLELLDRCDGPLSVTFGDSIGGAFSPSLSSQSPPSALSLWKHNVLAGFYDRPLLNTLCDDASSQRSAFSLPIPEPSPVTSAAVVHVDPAPRAPSAMAAASRVMQTQTLPRLESVPLSIPSTVAAATREALSQSQLRSNLTLAGTSEDEIAALTAKAPPVIMTDEDGDPFIHECTRDVLERRRPATTVFRRFATDKLIQDFVGKMFYFSAEALKVKLVSQHSARSFLDIATESQPSMSSSALDPALATAVPSLLQLPVVVNVKLFSEFCGQTPWLDLRLHHFVLPGTLWDNIVSFTQASDNLVAVAALVFGSHMVTALGDPISSFLFRARCSPLVLQTILYVPWVLNNALKQLWDMVRLPLFDPVTGDHIVLKNLGWAPLWSSQLSAVQFSVFSLTQFSSRFGDSQRSERPDITAVSKKAKTSISEQSFKLSSSSDKSSNSQSRSSTVPPKKGICLHQLMHNAKFGNKSPCRFGVKCRFIHDFNYVKRSEIIAHVKTITSVSLPDNDSRSALITSISDLQIGKM